MLVGNEAAVPLVAALGRTEQVEEIGWIPEQACSPQVVPVDQRRMQPLVGLQLVVRAVAGREVQVVEADRVAEAREGAEGHRVLVALDDRNQRFKRHLALRMVGRIATDAGLVIHLARRARAPQLHDGVRRGDRLAEEADRTEVFGGLGLDGRRHEPLGRVVKDEQPLVVEQHRPEKADFRVAQCLEFFRGEFVPVDVGHSGVIRAAVQVAAVGRKCEAFRQRGAKFELVQWRRVARHQLLGAHHAQLHHLHTGALDVGGRHRQ